MDRRDFLGSIAIPAAGATGWAALRPGLASETAAELLRHNGSAREIAQDESFWSFQPVRNVAPPEVLSADWVRTGVDRFVLARLESERVEAVHEWPFDAGALRRLAFYLLIPLLSWSGGALVERLIDAWLD